MTFNELVAELRNMYNNGNNKVAMIHLFGIKYHAEIDAEGCSLKQLAQEATGYESYATEISKGMKLAPYVKPIE